MADAVTLQQRLEKLREARASGVRRVRYSDGREHEYRSDAELASAIADIERQLSAGAAPKVAYLVSSKGL
ncbi:phage head-tail joining protein [Ancylobacter oerskovii]|uniref:Phage head-tail joining protein n=1 Tax=Ancylobacter oerskovii TaxID=459519 RepID=A0ABW4YVT5_9HYPH|nr:hypothetical protein [Ancylobacter oerskovii]MBS7544369.1 hypothetical protein [Ancylobacter oerskovii]